MTSTLPEVVAALQDAFYSGYSDYAAHNTETGRLLGFEVGGTGSTPLLLAEPDDEPETE
jgi:hypothetical protein